MIKRLSERIKKNILDLQYSKHLQYYNTSIIILFTYAIAVVVGFITEQIDYKNVAQVTFVGLISVSVIITILLFMLRSKDHMKNIINEVKKLKI